MRAPAGHEQFYYYCAASFISPRRPWQPKISALRPCDEPGNCLNPDTVAEHRIGSNRSRSALFGNHLIGVFDVAAFGEDDATPLVHDVLAFVHGLRSRHRTDLAG